MMIVTAPIILYCSKSVENKEIQIAESDAVTFNGRINIIFCIYAENGLYRKLLALRTPNNNCLREGVSYSSPAVRSEGRTRPSWRLFVGALSNTSRRRAGREREEEGAVKCI